MRNFLKTSVVTLAALVLTSCAPSLHPFYTDKDIVFNDALLGAWVNESGDKCMFTKSGDNHYDFLFVDDGSSRFEARLIELGGVRFLDLYPKTQVKNNDLCPVNFVPAHTLALLTISKDSISIAMMDVEWLKKLSDQNRLDLAHERLADAAIVLTAPTRELQTFVMKHAHDKEAFDGADVFQRLTPGK